MTRATVASVAFTLLVAAAASSATAPDFESMRIDPYTPPKPAPALSLPDLDGNQRTLSEFRGKVLLLFFWATW
jgi:cytochrome oxidase Cu insertion factor (SCO1/SenC/PrrC family)